MGLPGCGQEMSQGSSRAGLIPTLLLQLASAGMMCPTQCRVWKRKEVEGEGIAREHLDLWAAVQPGEGADVCSFWHRRGTWSVSAPA